MEIRFNHLHFLAADYEYQASSVALFGCPFDGTSSNEPGSRFAPYAIRQASQTIETYSPFLKNDLIKVAFCDLGDLELPFGNTSRILDLISQAITVLINDRKIPVVMGGEHLITWPVIRVLAKHYPDLMVIHLDAHADLREEYLGERYSHATVMRRVVEMVGEKNLIQLGIRSGTEEEFTYAHKIGSLYSLQDIALIQEKIRGRNIYLSLDLDILDPSILPGTGTPEPGGLTFQELIQLLAIFKEGKVVGLDEVELLPYQSTSQVSSIVAAKILRECLLLYFTQS